MGKSPINRTESSFPSPSEGSKTKGDINFKQSKEGGESKPLRDLSKLYETPTKSKSDSWVKGGGEGPFAGPEGRKKNSFGSGPGK